MPPVGTPHRSAVSSRLCAQTQRQKSVWPRLSRAPQHAQWLCPQTLFLTTCRLCKTQRRGPNRSRPSGKLLFNLCLGPDFLLPRTPFSLCFWALKWELCTSEAVDPACASAQKTPKTPRKTLILEKSAEQRSDWHRVSRSTAAGFCHIFGCLGAGAALLSCAIVSPITARNWRRNWRKNSFFLENRRIDAVCTLLMRRYADFSKQRVFFKLFGLMMGTRLQQVKRRRNHPPTQRR